MMHQPQSDGRAALRLGAVSVLLAGTVVLAGCTGSTDGSPTATTLATTPRIGWLDEPALPGTRLATAGTIPTSSLSAPSCRTSQLMIVPNGDAAAGTAFGELYLKNQSGQVCEVEGRPLVRLLGPQGQVVSQTRPQSGTAAATPVVLVPGSWAQLVLGPIGNDVQPAPCPPVDKIVLELGSGESARVSSTAVPPQENGISCSEEPALKEMPFSALAPPGPYINQITSIHLQVPARARPGTPLDYLAIVRLRAAPLHTAPGKSAVSMGPDFFPLCPIYRETVLDGPVRVAEDYELNCIALAGVRDQPLVVFGMQIAIPKTIPVGTLARISWQPLEPLGPAATSTVKVAG